MSIFQYHIIIKKMSCVENTGVRIKVPESDFTDSLVTNSLTSLIPNRTLSPDSLNRTLMTKQQWTHNTNILDIRC